MGLYRLVGCVQAHHAIRPESGPTMSVSEVEAGGGMGLARRRNTKDKGVVVKVEALKP